MPEMKVGTRLALGLLAALTPVVGVYTYTRIRSSTRIFEQDLKRETRDTELGLNTAIQFDIQRIIGDQGVAVAVLDKKGGLRFSLHDFPIRLPSPQQVRKDVGATGSSEFTQTANGRFWFCRIAPMRNAPSAGS